MAKVLVADDEPGTLEFVRTLLEGEGHTVQTAADGASALDKARLMKPDVLVTDIRMPGLTGNQLTAAVRAMDRLRYCYILVLTVAGEKADKMKAFLSGADDFIVKPARPGELIGRVEIGLRLHKAESEARAAAERKAAAEALLGGLVQEVEGISRILGTVRADAARSGSAPLLQAVEEAVAASDRSARMIRLRLEEKGPA